MSVTKKASQLSSVSSLENLSMIVADGSDLKRTSLRNLSPLLMDVKSSYVTDLNEATTPGLYLLDGTYNAANGPEGMDLYVGLLEVFQRYGTQTIFQRISNRKGQMATRARFNGEWSEWVVHS